jgi:hypothetical protein
MSADGNRIFFESADKLVADDTNGDNGCPPWGSNAQKLSIVACQDVYEWEAQGTGSCKSDTENGGCLYLLSGKGSEPSFFADASASGDSLFIFTGTQLVGQDKDGLIDAYNIRVNGGLASQNQSETAPCTGEACKGLPMQPPIVNSPGSDSFTGPGNQRPNRAQKKHGKGKHHKKKQKKKKHKNGRGTANTNRGASR